MDGGTERERKGEREKDSERLKNIDGCNVGR